MRSKQLGYYWQGWNLHCQYNPLRGYPTTNTHEMIKSYERIGRRTTILKNKTQKNKTVRPNQFGLFCWAQRGPVWGIIGLCQLYVGLDQNGFGHQKLSQFSFSSFSELKTNRGVQELGKSEWRVQRLIGSIKSKLKQIKNEMQRYDNGFFISKMYYVFGSACNEYYLIPKGIDLYKLTEINIQSTLV